MAKILNLDALAATDLNASFTLNGIDFKCVDAVSAVSMMNLTVAMGGISQESLESGEAEFGEAQIKTMMEFLTEIVVKEQRDTFIHELHRGDPPVSMAQVNALMEWAVEVFSGAPLDELSDSSNSAAPTPSSSTENSSAPVRPPAFAAFQS